MSKTINIVDGTIETYCGTKKITGTKLGGSPGYWVITGKGMTRRSWAVSRDEYKRAQEALEVQ